MTYFKTGIFVKFGRFDFRLKIKLFSDVEHTCAHND